MDKIVVLLFVTFLLGACLFLAPSAIAREEYSDFQKTEQDDVATETRRERNSGFTCRGKTKCAQMDSCAEARYYLTECGLRRLDRDNDGVPCESICR